MRFEATQATRALALIRSAIEPIRVKPGCRSCHLAQELGAEETLRYTEEWASADAFRRHVRSADFWPILLAIDLCCTEPQVRIGDFTLRGGLDFLLRLREASPLDALESTDPLAPDPRDGPIGTRQLPGTMGKEPTAERHRARRTVAAPTPAARRLRKGG